MTSIIRLDTRGRLVVPREFREPLGLREGDRVLLSLDQDSGTLSVSPIADEKKKLAKFEIIFGDAPRALASVADYLADENVDLIMTQSRSTDRGKSARWEVIADVSACKKTFAQMKKDLVSSGAASGVTIEKYTRDCLHRGASEQGKA